MNTESRRGTIHENIAESEQVDEFMPETEVVRSYLGVIEKNTGRRPRLEILSSQEIAKASELPQQPGLAYRIIINEATGKEKNVGIFDWEDTLEDTSEKKNSFYSEMFKLCGSKLRNSAEAGFLEICQAISKASKILPADGAHPAKYSSLLEMATITELVQMVKNNRELSLLKKSTIEPDEKFKKREIERMEYMAAGFIENHVLPKLSGSVKTTLDTKDGVKRSYFKESEDRSMAFSFKEKPAFVSQEIWKQYLKKINETTIPVKQAENFDLPENVRFIISASGEPIALLERISQAVKKLADGSHRIPDEIIVTAKGEENKILEELVANIYFKAQIVLVDNDPKKLEDLGAGIIPVHAHRKNDSDRLLIPPDMESADIDHTKHSELINNAQKTFIFSQGQRIDYAKRKKVSELGANQLKEHYTESQEATYEFYQAMESGEINPSLVFDLDGVLVQAGVDTASSDENMNNYVLKNNEKISEFKKRIADLRMLGFRVGICTGRGYEFVKGINKEIMPDNAVDYAICEGGAVTYSFDHKNKKTNAKRELNKTMDPEGAYLLLNKRDEIVGEILEAFGGQIESGKEIGLSFNKPQNIKTIDEYYDKIKFFLSELGYEKHLHITHSSTAVDITPKGVDKMAALKEMQKDDVFIYFGDEKNDETAMTESIVNVIPGNGRYSTKNMAKSSEFGIVSGKQEINGVVDALEVIQLFMRHAKRMKQVSSTKTAQAEAV